MPGGNLRNICRMSIKAMTGQRRRVARSRRAGRRKVIGIRGVTGRKRRVVIEKATGKKGVIEVMRETSGEMRTGTVREEYLSGEILWGKSF